MSKKVTVTIFVFVFLICTGSASGFVTHRDSHGFSLDCPEGWQVRVIGRGCKVKGKIIVFTQLIRPPGMPSGAWQANVLLYNAPPLEFEQLEAIANKMRDTFRVDPAWARREAQEQIRRSQIISQSANEVAQIIRQSYEKRSAVMDEISRKWSNAILGRVDLVDPETGEIDWGVPSDSNYYWKQGDVIIGTETHERPSIDSRLLSDLDELIKD